MVRPKKTDTPVREKILRVADDLFYRQGYHPTGTNQIIAEAGVSKATFYAHFPSKEDLAVAYVRKSAARSLKFIRDELERIDSPLERCLMFQVSIRKYLVESDFRGCNFSNIAREFPDIHSPVRAEVIRFENEYRDVLRQTVRDLFDADSKRAKRIGLGVDEVADRYYLILEGAINASANFHDEWPLDAAGSAVRDLLRA